MKSLLILMMSVLVVISCKEKGEEFDASGVFEAEDYIISAQANGVLSQFDLKEGDVLRADQLVGKIDCSQVVLQKAQVEARIESLSAKRGQSGPQVKVFEQQLKSQESQLEVMNVQLQVIQKEKNRLSKLVEAEASPSKSLDDVDGQINILLKKIEASQSQINITAEQIRAHKSQVAIQNRGILSERNPMEKQIAQIEDQLTNCTVTNPIEGTVLTKYVNTHEMVNVGKPLYKVADLQTMILRAYITGDQFSTVKLNEPISIYVDNGDGSKTYEGTIMWISDQAEFTPKTIQTKDERANLVYAIKAEVANDGFLKMGMYGEIKF